MERLREVLIRVNHLSEEEADKSVERVRTLLEAGIQPEEVLVSEYGVDIDHLRELLNPKETADVSE